MKDRDVSIFDMKIFLSLTEKRNMSDVAKLFNVTPSAISKKIKKLRTVYDDELFVVNGNQLDITLKAKRIERDLSRSLDSFAKTLSVKDGFDSHDFYGPIVLKVPMSILEAKGFALYNALSTGIPNACISLRPWDGIAEEEIVSGVIDSGVHLLSNDKLKSLYQKRIYDDEIVLVHCDFKKKYSLEHYLDGSLVVVEAQGWNEQRYRVLDAFANNNFVVNPKCFLGTINMGLDIIRQGGVGMLLPKSLVPKEGYKYIQLSSVLNLPQFQFVYCSKVVNRGDAKHRHLYSIIKSVLT